MSETLNTVTLAVDQRLIGLYADLTNDYNPLHVDPDFAAKSPFKGIIAHGTMSLNLIWESVAATFGTAAAQGGTLDIRFTRPVRVGDVITAGGEAQDNQQFSVWARNQDGVNVIEGTLMLARSALA